MTCTAKSGPAAECPYRAAPTVVEAARVEIPRRLVPEILQWLEDEADRWPDDTAFQGDIEAFEIALRTLAGEGKRCARRN